MLHTQAYVTYVYVLLPITIHTMQSNTKTSFAARLAAQLHAYSTKSEPIQIDDQSQRYVRAIVSGFNTSNGRQFSVLQYGTGLLVGLRPDIQEYMRKQLPGQHQPVVELSAAEHLQRAVELLRVRRVSRDEMHAELSKYITSEDDYLI